MIQSVQWGAVGGATPTDRSGAANEVLASSQTRFDEAGRPYEAQPQRVFGLGRVAPLRPLRDPHGRGPGGQLHGRRPYRYGDADRRRQSYVLTRRSTTVPGARRPRWPTTRSQTTFVYDGADRRIEITDALGNVVDNQFDAAGNLILSTRTETCTVTSPPVADETFSSAMFYDSLNRLVLRAEQGADGRSPPTFRA